MVNEREVKEVFGADMAYLFHEHVYLEAQYDRLLSSAGIAGVLLEQDANKVEKLAQQVKDSYRLITRFIHRNSAPNRLFEALSFEPLSRVAEVPTYHEWSKKARDLAGYLDLVKRR